MNPIKQARPWISAGATHQGKIRSQNQDAFLDRADIGLWAVADGMGGHASGERASQLVIELLSGLPAPELLGRSVRQAEALILQANQRLIDEAEAIGTEIIGTTVVLLLAVGDAGALLWVGDSRIYRLRSGQLEQLTVDHTEVQKWVSEGKLTSEQAAVHPYASILSRAIGAEPELAVDTAFESMQDGDRYLLCSDGLTKELSHEQIQQLLGSGEPADVARLLVENTCAAGGRDNVTVVVVDFPNSR